MHQICILTLMLTLVTFCCTHVIEPSRTRLAAPAQGGFRYHLILEDQKYNLTWTFDEKTVNFEVRVNATGWFGLGFSPLPPPDSCGGCGPSQSKGRKRRADGPRREPPVMDLVYVWIDGTGKSQISDRRLTTRGNTAADSKQDYTLIRAEKTATGMSAIFSRKRYTCDENDVQFTDDFVNVYWTYSNTMPKGESDFKMGQTNEGQKTTYLFSANKIRQNPQIMKYEITAPNVKLLNDYDTFFWCEIRKMPQGASPNLIRFDPILTPGNEGVVHHIYSYTCNNDSLAQYVNKGAECFYDREKTQRHPIHTCDTNYISAHSISGDITYYSIPESAKQDKYLRVEFHWFNPNLIQNIKDNSTARYYFPNMNSGRMRSDLSDQDDISDDSPVMNRPPPPPPPPKGGRADDCQFQQQIVKECPTWRRY